ncbi:MAG: hypothetical protein H7A42_06065 [Chlamydiales bacterium]|nr:hypothetical protein [Chlamydiales bacterium]
MQKLHLFITFYQMFVSEPTTFVQDRIKPVVEEAIMQNKDFVFIPVVFQSRIEPHNVLFIVNIKDQVIEYYDPKGAALEIEQFHCSK